MTKAPVVLITATTPWPLSARLAMQLISYGCVVAASCPPGHVLKEVSGIGTIYSNWWRGSMAALEGAILGAKPDIVIPCDDRAVWQLHELYEKRAALRELIEASIGSPEHFRTVSTRVDLLEKARRMGVIVPEAQSVRSEEDIRGWFASFPGPAVVKLDGTWGGSGVAIVQSAEQGLAAWRGFKAPERVGTAWKRWLINRDPLAFWSQSRARQRSVSVHRFIQGRSANAMAACWRGQVLGVLSVEVLCTQGPTGSSTIVRLIQHEGITSAVRTLVQGLMLSGFCGLDFILEQGTETAYLIELNARCTQLGHLVLPGQGDLAGLLCEKLGGRIRVNLQTSIERDVIAFFPHALAWNADSSYMQQCHHDVPWSEPALVRELLREPWAERQWLARFYHRIRGRKALPLPNPQNFLRLAAEYGFSSGSAEQFDK